MCSLHCQTQTKERVPLSQDISCPKDSFNEKPLHGPFWMLKKTCRVQLARPRDGLPFACCAFPVPSKHQMTRGDIPKFEASTPTGSSYQNRPVMAHENRVGWVGSKGEKFRQWNHFINCPSAPNELSLNCASGFYLWKVDTAFAQVARYTPNPTWPAGCYLLEWVDFAKNSGEASRKSFHRTDSLSGNCLPLANFVTPGLEEVQHSSERVRVDILWHQSGRRGMGVRKVLRTIPPCANNHRIYIFVTQASMRKDNGNWHWPGRGKETLLRSFYGRIVVRSGIM